jgi:hypothetical protein
VRSFQCAQDLRNWRWSALDDERSYIHDAGWHFSFLSSGDDVHAKLDTYLHQDAETQCRRSESVCSLIAS